VEIGFEREDASDTGILEITILDLVEALGKNRFQDAIRIYLLILWHINCSLILKVPKNE